MNPLNGAKGVATRVERARIRREVGAPPGVDLSMEVLAAVLEDRPAALDKVMVWEVLGWAWVITSGSHRRESRRRRLLRHAGIGQYLLVHEITDRQRAALCHALRSPALRAAAS